MANDSLKDAISASFHLHMIYIANKQIDAYSAHLHYVLHHRVKDFGTSLHDSADTLNHGLVKALMHASGISGHTQRPLKLAFSHRMIGFGDETADRFFYALPSGSGSENV